MGESAIKKIALLGYNEVQGTHFWNGVARVIYNQTQWFRNHGYEVIHYNFFSHEEYKSLYGFLEENAVDVALWHMTTLKIKGRIQTPCPLVCLWHNDPSSHRDVAAFVEKYHLKPWQKKLLNNKVGNWMYVRLHNVLNNIAFTYVTACADRYVLLSQYFKPLFFPTKLFPKKVTAIPNSISAEMVNSEIDLAAKEQVVLFMGRLDIGQKRIDLLLKIWEIIEKKYSISDWKLDICGGGPDEETLKQMKEDLGLKQVGFRGHVNPEEYYKKASIFCMTSAFEGFGLVVVEAAAYGCVPMAFESYAAVKDLIDDGENGCLIKAFDIEAYAEALAELMMNGEERNRMALNAKTHSNLFSPDSVMAQWEQLFNEVLLEKRNNAKKRN